MAKTSTTQKEKTSLTEKVASAVPDKLVPDKLKPQKTAEVGEKEQAEKQYQQVDDQHPEQSIYVKKAATDDQQDDQQAVAAQKKSETFEAIEEILADDLADVYQSLDAREQEEFKRKGEEAAGKIEEMIKSLKIKAKQVLNIVKDWLITIPKANKHFLEQQSKIKTDKIIALSEEYKKEQRKLK